eukprot:1157544-Pelagomonas_calceolata.AAC.3
MRVHEHTHTTHTFFALYLTLGNTSAPRSLLFCLQQIVQETVRLIGVVPIWNARVHEVLNAMRLACFAQSLVAQSFSITRTCWHASTPRELPRAIPRALGLMSP